jgi:hypothetical protein
VAMSVMSVFDLQGRCRRSAGRKDSGVENVRAEWAMVCTASQPPQAHTQADSDCSVGGGRCLGLKKAGERDNPRHSLLGTQCYSQLVGST